MRWEYFTYDLSGMNCEQRKLTLNEFGQQLWELLHIDSQSIAYFKRACPMHLEKSSTIYDHSYPKTGGVKTGKVTE